MYSHYLIRFLVLCLVVTVRFAGGQVYTPPVQPNTQPAGGGVPQNNTTIVNQDNQSRNNQMLGNDVPFFDPTNNTFAFDGKTFNVQDNQVFRARRRGRTLYGDPAVPARRGPGVRGR